MVSAPPRPGGRGCPWLVVRQPEFRPVREQKSQHFLAPRARCPRERRRLELSIAQVNVAASVEQPGDGIGGALIREDVQRGHAEAIRFVGSHTGVQQPLSNLVPRFRIPERMHERRVPACPAPRNRWVGAMIEQETHDVRVRVMDGFVEARLCDTSVLANHLERASRVSIATALEHLVLELTPRVCRSYVAGWNCRERMRGRALEQCDDVGLFTIARSRERRVVADAPRPTFREWIGTGGQQHLHHAHASAAYGVV